MNERFIFTFIPLISGWDVVCSIKRWNDCDRITGPHEKKIHEKPCCSAISIHKGMDSDQFVVKSCSIRNGMELWFKFNDVFFKLLHELFNFFRIWEGYVHTRNENFLFPVLSCIIRINFFIKKFMNFSHIKDCNIFCFHQFKNKIISTGMTCGFINFSKWFSTNSKTILYDDFRFN